MPNHCYQQVHIYGLRNKVRELYEHLLVGDHPEFFNLISPMPEEVNDAPPTREVGGYELPAWYAWRVKNWGSKWDVAEVEITQPLMLHDDEDVSPESMNASFTFNCWTAWSPPIPIWDKLVEMGLSVDADYQDEGGCFEGTYLNGEDKCWEPEIEQEEEDA
jgi:hypothetical protein